MRTIKNPVELPSGLISCQYLVSGEWSELIMSSVSEYEIHEDSEWQDIKPCPQAEKDEHEQANIRAGVLAQLAELDLPNHTLALALTGDELALQRVKDVEVEKEKLRALL